MPRNPFLTGTATAALVFATPAITTAETRTWTSAKTGKTLTAEFIELTTESVVVRDSSGNTRSLPLDFLTEADIAAARKLQDEADGYSEVERVELPDDDGPVELIVLGIPFCCDTQKQEFIKAAGAAGAVVKINDRTSQATLSASSSAAAQKAVDALMQAGYHGDVASKKGGDDVQFPNPESRPEKVDGATFALGLPICCDRAVATIKEAIGDVKGAKSEKVSAGSYDFKVSGKFDPNDVINSLRVRGFNAVRR